MARTLAVRESEAAALGPQAPMTELDEITLERARRGDGAALEALVERYQRPVWALVGRMLIGKPDRVEDVAQDVFVKVLVGIPRFDPGGAAKLSTWILTIATRTCIDVLRKVTPLAALPEDAAPEASPEEAAVERDLARRVERCVGALPPDWRAVLVLRAYHDFDYPEIARALGVEIGTVKSRLARAREALRRALGKDGAP